jgi:hypothetical protein
VWVIAWREKPGKPWEFVINHSGTKSKAQKSAAQAERQEREICGHPKAEVKVFTRTQWEGKASGKKRRKSAKPKAESESSGDKLSLLDLLNSPVVEDSDS